MAQAHQDCKGETNGYNSMMTSSQETNCAHNCIHWSPFDQKVPQITMWHELQHHHCLQSYEGIDNKDNNIRMTLCMYTMCYTHRFPHSDHSMQPDHIRVFELSHDGSFLQKLDFICFIWSWLQHLHSHFHSTPRGLPHPLVYCPKLARTKMFHNTALVNW